MALGVILSAFARALGQLGDRRFRAVLWRGLALTLGLLAGLTALLVWGVGALVGDTVALPLLGEVAWVDDVLSWAFLALMIALSVFLMVPVAAAFVSIFLEEVAGAVEARHYPALPPAGEVSLLDGLRDGASALGLLIGANAIALALTLVFPIGGLPVFYAVNGLLLGREYFTVAAMRRVGRAEAARLSGASVSGFCTKLRCAAPGLVRNRGANLSNGTKFRAARAFARRAIGASPLHDTG